jgi:hypothetical protein
VRAFGRSRTGSGEEHVVLALYYHSRPTSPLFFWLSRDQRLMSVPVQAPIPGSLMYHQYDLVHHLL